jgi:uncharacterized protein YcbX
MATGTLTGIHLHPVKGCHRVEVDRAVVGAGGLVGDREWQVFGDDGEVVTQRSNPMLALVQPTLVEGGLRLSAPGRGTVEVRRPARADRVVRALLGDEVSVGDGGDEAAGWLSAVTGTPCRLVALAAPDARRIDLVPNQPVSLADATPVLVANEASWRDLRQRAVEAFGIERFRPNLIVDGAEPWAEDTWQRFSIGDARLEGVVPMPRCTVPQVDQDSGKRHREPAVALRAHRWCTDAPGLSEGWRPFFRGKGLFGLGATIGEPGAVVRGGDPVEVHSTAPPLIAPPTS